MARPGHDLSVLRLLYAELGFTRQLAAVDQRIAQNAVEERSKAEGTAPATARPIQLIGTSGALTALLDGGAGDMAGR